MATQMTGERITEDGTLTADYAGRYEVNWSQE